MLFSSRKPLNFLKTIFKPLKINFTFCEGIIEDIFSPPERSRKSPLAVKQKNRIKANIDISVIFCKLMEVHMHFLRYYDLVSIASQNFCYYLSKERFLRVCLLCPAVNCSKQSFRGQCLDSTQPSESYDTEFLTGSFLQIIVHRTKSFHL